MTPTMLPVMNRCSECGKGPAEYTQKDRELGVLPPGTELDGGNIVVGAKLGKGGFGITYIALDRESGERIALKELFPKHQIMRCPDGRNIQVISGYEEQFRAALRSFIREAKTINALRHHPNVVHVKFMFQENGTAYYGMDMLQGKNLFGWMRDTGRQKLSAREACTILNPIMDALAFCHRTGVLHRDVSPDNIFIREDPSVKGGIVPTLIDFGAAYVAIDNFTHTFPKVQKRGYSPIEQMTQKGGGPYSDVYAFCATFYHLITGNCPPSAVDTIITPIKLPSEQGADISPAAETVLMKGLERAYTDRIQTMGDLQRRLCSALSMTPYQAAVKGSTIQPPIPPTPPQPVRPEKSHEVSKPSDSAVSDVSRVNSEVIDVPERENNAGKRVIGYILECLLFFLPCILFAGGWGVLLGYGLMTLVDTLLCMIPGHGTLGMRMFGLHFENSDNVTIVSSLLYSMLYALVPFTLLDGLVALPKGAEMLTLREKMTDLRIGEPAQEGSHDENDSYYASGSVYANPKKVASVPTATIKCKDGPMVGRTFRVEDGFSMGRNSDMCEILMDASDMNVSRRHCRFQYAGQQWYLRNESANGTTVDGKLLELGQTSALSSGTLLKVGKSTFVFLA